MRWRVARSLSPVVLLGLLVMLASPLTAEPQHASKVYRIGVLSPGSPPSNSPSWQAFLQGLREFGYVEGRNITIERRFAEGNAERLPALAAELVRLNVDVIVTIGIPSIHAARNATRTIPIVMLEVGNPVGDGLVASLARPGGNVTGLSNSALDLVPKRMELLKECVPKVSRVAVLVSATLANRDVFLKATQDSAQALGLKLQVLQPNAASDLEAAFAAMTREHADGLQVIPDPLTVGRAKEIVALAIKHRLPGIYPYRQHAELGGLVSYGANPPEMYRRSASFIDKILKGTKPADLPVEQPTKFELVINLKTAKALGLTIPQSLLLRADQVIE